MDSNNLSSILPYINKMMAQESMGSKLIQLLLFGAVLSIIPILLITITSFTRIIIVLSMLRTAIGLQQSPPNQLLIGLAIFLTFFVMSPVFEQSYQQGIKPLLDQQLKEEQALPLILSPFKKFMFNNTRTRDLQLFVAMAKSESFDTQDAQDIPLQVLVPSFIISELRKAFEIGFLIFLPFLVIDIVVSSVLMAMGMMMMPPVMLSLPLKVIFFVLIDGWYLIVGSLVKSFS